MAQFFRTSTPMGDWRSFKFTMLEDGPWTEGQLYLVQETCGVLFLGIQYDSAGCKKAKTIVVDEEGVLVYHIEKVMVDKLAKAGFSFLPGDKVYWSGVAGDPVIPNAQSGYYWIGICVWPAAALDDEVMIDLKGDKISLTEPL